MAVSDASRVRDALLQLAIGRGDVKKLRGQPNVWRLRVGVFRVLYMPNGER